MQYKTLIIMSFSVMHSHFLLHHLQQAILYFSVVASLIKNTTAMSDMVHPNIVHTPSFCGVTNITQSSSSENIQNSINSSPVIKGGKTGCTSSVFKTYFQYHFHHTITVKSIQLPCSYHDCMK